MGEGSVPGRPHRVLLGYGTIPFTIHYQRLSLGFPFSATINNAAINILVHMSFYTGLLFLLTYSFNNEAP